MTPGDLLDLVDYRRRVAEIYAQVRRVAADSPERARHEWVASRDRLFHTHPQSPWRGTATDEARTVDVFDYDPAWRLVVPVTPPVDDRQILLPHSGEGATPATPVGTVEVVGTPLTLYWLEQYGGGLFLPFLDETNGAMTYGGGRYLLDTAKSADLGGGPGRTLVLDFNFAYHPSCVHNPRWSCPLSPQGNRLPMPVRAGEHVELLH